MKFGCVFRQFAEFPNTPDDFQMFEYATVVSPSAVNDDVESACHATVLFTYCVVFSIASRPHFEMLPHSVQLVSVLP